MNLVFALIRLDRHAAPLAGLLAWLSLDDDDSDPARFLTYLIAALQTRPPLTGINPSWITASAICVLAHQYLFHRMSNRYFLFSHLFQRLQHLRRAGSHSSLWKVLAAFPEQEHHQQANTRRQDDIG